MACAPVSTTCTSALRVLQPLIFPATRSGIFAAGIYRAAVAICGVTNQTCVSFLMLVQGCWTCHAVYAMTHAMTCGHGVGRSMHTATCSLHLSPLTSMHHQQDDSLQGYLVLSFIPPLVHTPLSSRWHPCPSPHSVGHTSYLSMHVMYMQLMCMGTQKRHHVSDCLLPCLQLWALEKRSLRCELCNKDYGSKYITVLQELLDANPAASRSVM